MDGDELQRLMTAYQAGSLEAFERIYGSLAAPVLGYLTSLCRERAHAEDLLQESFLQVHRSRHTYRPELPLRPWVFAIARHVWLMDLPDAFAAAGDGDRAAGAAGARRRRALADRDSLRRALDAILPDRREALLLHHVWGFSFAEIGQLLGFARMPPSCDRAAAWAISATS